MASFQASLSPKWLNIDDGNRVAVIDDMLESAVFAKLSLAMIASPFKNWRIDDPNKQTSSGSIPCDYLQIDLDVGDFRKHPSFPMFHAAASIYLGRDDLFLDRVFCNALQFGDAVYTHKDYISGHPGVTVMMFLNQTWDPNWGGEIVFFNKDFDARACVNPKAGRVVIFSNAINHRPGMPTRNSPEIRVTLNVRFSHAE